jgi:hypothetical protein
MPEKIQPAICPTFINPRMPSKMKTIDPKTIIPNQKFSISFFISSLLFDDAEMIISKQRK